MRSYTTQGLSDKELAYKNFKRIARAYKRDGVYKCATDPVEYVPYAHKLSGFAYSRYQIKGIALFAVCGLATAALITILSYLAGKTGVIISFVIILAVPLFAAYKLLYGPTVKLEKGRLIIKNKDKEIWHDINTFVAKHKSTALYILLKEGETEIQIAHIEEAAAFACLINCIRNNELEKLENLTLDEFSVIYSKSSM